MPYSSVDELPDHVKKKGKKKARQWMAIFNDVMGKGGSEESAFKQANGSVKESEFEGAAEKYYMDSYDVMTRRMDQEAANYRVLGGTSERACASCRWFVSPNQCVVVSGDISPTGISDLFRESKPSVVEPMPVTIVKAGEAEVKRPGLVDWFAKVFGRTPEPRLSPPVQRPLLQLKELEDGRTRFLLRVSNNFVDREKQIITEAAHKEYVEWADKEQAYPELWVWHAKGSRLGEADWLDVCNGALVAGGLIDEGQEEMARKVSAVYDGVSHGYLYVSKGQDIVKYRTYELSMLPNEAAANNRIGSGIRLVEEDLVPFSAAKKAKLTELYGEETVSAFEKETDEMVEAFKAQGIAYKEVDETVPMLGEIRGLTTAITELSVGLDAKFKGIDEKLAAHDKQIESGIEEAMKPRVAGAVAGFSAATAESTVVDDAEAAKLGAGNKEQNSWFHDKVMGAITRGL